MITPKNILQHEIIGLHVEIENSADEGLKGVKGQVIDESQNMLKIRTSKHEMQVPKKAQTFIFTLPDKTKVKVDGKLLHGDSIERLKKKQPRKWE